MPVMAVIAKIGSSEDLQDTNETQIHLYWLNQLFLSQLYAVA